MKTILIAAQSLDGFITKHNNPGTSWCSAEDKSYFTASLKLFDCCIMGAGTFKEHSQNAINNGFSKKRRIILTRTPEKYSHVYDEGFLEFLNLSPQDCLRKLESYGCQNCVILGGGEIYSQFLSENLVDELWLTIEPVIFGSGTPLASGKLDQSYKLLSTENLSPNTLLLKYAKQSASNP